MKTYEPGRQIDSMIGFEIAFEKSTLLFVKKWNKTAHPIILASMPYTVVRSFVDQGQVFIAEKIKEAK